MLSDGPGDVPTPTPPPHNATLPKGQDVRRESRCGSRIQVTSLSLIKEWKIREEHFERVQIEVECDCQSVNIVHT